MHTIDKINWKLQQTKRSGTFVACQLLRLRLWKMARKKSGKVDPGSAIRIQKFGDANPQIYNPKKSIRILKAVDESPETLVRKIPIRKIKSRLAVMPIESVFEHLHCPYGADECKWSRLQADRIG